MKALIILSLVSFNALAIDCQIVGERKFNALKEELVMEGKGVREINDILQARIKICDRKCPPIHNLGICMAVIPKKD